MKDNTEKQIVYLTDDLISMYSKDNVLTNYQDAFLKPNYPVAYKKGPYDPKIFGSMFTDTCNCGITKTPGMECPRCHSVLLDKQAAFSRYARIELPVMYCSELKIANLVRFLRKNIPIKSRAEEKLPLSTTQLELAQFDWDDTDECVYYTMEVTDHRKCSYEGLLTIIYDHYPNLLETYRTYVNYYVLVLPIRSRLPVISFDGNKKRLNNDALTTIYKNILYVTQVYYKSRYPSLPTEYAKNAMNGCVRRLVSKLISGSSSLLAPSKANLSRTIQGNRLPDSGRCTIVPAPDLRVDQIAIPRHLMYEACRLEFTDYLAKNLNISDTEAKLVWKLQANTEKVQKMFDKYIEGDEETGQLGKYVIINRAPTLYELGLMACKVVLTNDYVMRLPMALCKAFNADFDGDAMTFYAVPNEMTETIVSVMNPKNLLYFKKSHKPLFTPTHEFLKGLIIGTRMKYPENIEEIYDLEEAKKKRKTERNFRYQTVFHYNGKDTTLARELFSEYFGVDINEYLSSVKADSINAKNMVQLYANLEQFEDRTERIRLIQDLAAQISTLSGTSALTLDEMYTGFDNEKLQQIKDIENNEILSQQEKEIKIRIIYDQYVKEMTQNLKENKPEVALAISDSSRAKLNQLADMVFTSFNVGPDGEFHVSESSLVNGMTPRDYINLAIENRATQDIKVMAVPDSGYSTRQFIYVATSHYFSDQTDPQNPGILLKASDAVGRTKIDGTIVEKSNSNELIKVRSIVTSKCKDPYMVTKDMVTNLFNYKDGSRIGMSTMSSITEQLTQSGLALKHGGSLFNFDSDARFIAPENGTLQVLGKFLVFTGKSGKVYKYPKPDNFVVSYSPENNYLKDEILGITYHKFTPAYRLNCIQRLCGSSGIRSSKSFMKNNVLVSDCYCIADGKIHYDIDQVTNNLVVSIGNVVYEYNPEACYFLPEGTEVKKYQRFCSGLMNFESISSRINDYVDCFYFFRNQFNELLELAPELIEFAYSVLVKLENGRIVRRSVIQTIANSPSAYTSLSFGYASNVFKKIDHKGIKYVPDTMSRVLLSLLTDNLFK